VTLPLDQIYASIGAIAAFAGASGEEPDTFLARHAPGYWGEITDDDWETNQCALEHGLLVMSAYTLRTGERVWIITEADRSTTTIRLPAVHRQFIHVYGRG